MSFFQNINPFSWRKRALQAEQNYDYACECFNHLQDENVELKKLNEILSVQYEVPTDETIAMVYTVSRVPVDKWTREQMGFIPKSYTNTEAKLLLDIANMRQQVAYYEELFTKVREVEGKDLITKVANSSDKIRELENIIEIYSDRLEKVTEKLVKAQDLNKQWFETFLGFKRDEFILLTQNLRGAELGLVELGNERSD